MDNTMGRNGKTIAEDLSKIGNIQVHTELQTLPAYSNCLLRCRYNSFFSSASLRVINLLYSLCEQAGVSHIKLTLEIVLEISEDMKI